MTQRSYTSHGRAAARVLASVALLLGAACASTASAQSPTPTPMQTETVARSVWRRPLPQGLSPDFVAAYADVAIVGSHAGTQALDVITGRTLWRTDDDAMAAAFAGDRVFYGGRRGTLVARSLRTGHRIWSSTRICNAIPGDRLSGIFIVRAFEEDIVIGCEGGRIARISRANGALLARADGFPAERISQIVDLGSCAYGVTGWSSGAALTMHSEIVRCTSLAPIVSPRNETYILGSVGHTAILDDTCCFRRLDAYRPATILRIDLVTGTALPPIDEAPDSALHPTSTLPVDAYAFLNRNSLYIGIGHRLYWYGNALALTAPAQMIASDLDRPPIVLPQGLFALRQRYANGSSAISVARLQGATIEPVWTLPAHPGMGLFYDPEVSRTVLSLAGAPETYARTTDGKLLNLKSACRVRASTQKMLLAVCTTDTLAGNIYVEYLAGYRWPP